MALFGATGFIGARVLDELVARGHAVKALARNAGRLEPRAGMEAVSGNAADPAAVALTVGGTEAVISCLGNPRGERRPPGHLASLLESICTQMERESIRRLIAVSGAGVTLPGERKPFPHNLLSALVRLAARNAVEAKQRELDTLLAHSTLDWTAVRPTRVVEGTASARFRVSTDSRAIGVRVTRGDLAAFMVAQLTDSTYIRKAPFVSS